MMGKNINFFNDFFSENLFKWEKIIRLKKFMFNLEGGNKFKFITDG